MDQAFPQECKALSSAVEIKFSAWTLSCQSQVYFSHFCLCMFFKKAAQLFWLASGNSSRQAIILTCWLQSHTPQPLYGHNSHRQEKVECVYVGAFRQRWRAWLIWYMPQQECRAAGVYRSVNLLARLNRVVGRESNGGEKLTTALGNMWRVSERAKKERKLSGLRTAFSSGALQDV